MQFWPPRYNAIIEGVEGKETKMVYWVQPTLRRDLKNPGFFSPEKRLRGELTEDCKIMKAKIRVFGTVVH